MIDSIEGSRFVHDVSSKSRCRNKFSYREWHLLPQGIFFKKLLEKEWGHKLGCAPDHKNDDVSKY